MKTEDRALRWSPHSVRFGLAQPARKAGSTILLAVVALGLLTACGNRAQEEAFTRAQEDEQHLTLENAVHVRAAYERVVAMDAGSACAERARARLAALEQRVKAEEQRKAVFQEHGID